MVQTFKSNRGSILLLTLCLVTALAIAAYAVYNLSLGTYRLSQRNEYRARAKALADSELEYVFYRIETAMMQGAAASDVPTLLADICYPVVPADEVLKSTILGKANGTLTSVPFAQSFQNLPEGWTVTRWITYENAISGVQEGSVVFNYFTVRVEVKSGPNCPFAIDFFQGRQMNNSVASIFQYNIFAQGDLEFSPDGITVINGDIAANGKVALGAHASGASQLTMNAGVYWIPPHSGDSIETTSIKDTNGNVLLNLRGPIWSTGESQQVQALQTPLNLLGGLNAVELAQAYGVGGTASKLFGDVSADPTSTAYQVELASASNQVYRSVIAPPPTVAAATANQHGNGDSYLSEYPAVTDPSTMALGGAVKDDPGVAALRAYNRAGMIVTINADQSFTVSIPGTGNTIDSSSFTGTVAGVATPVVSQTTMYDLREAKTVAIADINVGALAQVISSNSGLFPNSTFNGVLYVYLAGSNSATPAAVRLQNGSKTPGYNSANPVGFTVATNGGMYVVGDYNSITNNNGADVPLVQGDGTPTDPASIGTVNPSALMADQITILSSNWTTAMDTLVNTNHNPMATADSRIAPAGSTTTIAAGLLTGNTVAQAGSSVYSGGGDNLVRFLEDWNYGGQNGATVNFYGSFGQLFNSTTFTGQWYSPTGDAADPHSYIYNHPKQRVYSFNKALKSKPPPCSPNITAYNRGNVFIW